jgi:hypothetical protein
MTNERSIQDTARSAPASAERVPIAPETAATGVAAGGLGTAANLEETQVLRTTDIDASEGAELGAAADGGEPPAEPVPPASVERVPRHRVRSSSQPARGLAGVLAVALVVLAGVVILATRDDGTAGGGSVLPPAGSTAPVETAAPDREEGREGDGDKGKKCNGKGRGNNCDGGGDDD